MRWQQVQSASLYDVVPLRNAELPRATDWQCRGGETLGVGAAEIPCRLSRPRIGSWPEVVAATKLMYSPMGAPST